MVERTFFFKTLLSKGSGDFAELCCAQEIDMIEKKFLMNVPEEVPFRQKYFFKVSCYSKIQKLCWNNNVTMADIFTAIYWIVKTSSRAGEGNCEFSLTQNFLADFSVCVHVILRHFHLIIQYFPLLTRWWIDLPLGCFFCPSFPQLEHFFWQESQVKRRSHQVIFLMPLTNKNKRILYRNKT